MESPETTWNHLKPPETIWNHLKPSETTYENTWNHLRNNLKSCKTNRNSHFYLFSFLLRYNYEIKRRKKKRRKKRERINNWNNYISSYSFNSIYHIALICTFIGNNQIFLVINIIIFISLYYIIINHPCYHGIKTSPVMITR